jgi:hypothetical protein
MRGALPSARGAAGSILASSGRYVAETGRSRFRPVNLGTRPEPVLRYCPQSAQSLNRRAAAGGCYPRSALDLLNAAQCARSKATNEDPATRAGSRTLITSDLPTSRRPLSPYQPENRRPEATAALPRLASRGDVCREAVRVLEAGRLRAEWSVVDVVRVARADAAGNAVQAGHMAHPVSDRVIGASTVTTYT